ncbi:ABC transporter ATP-binding protein [Paenibacillus wynnii]|uniref:ABC transporter ATP-binding protein n=1 Tax=Paenibacillus wynnii TaxID=268407 RepID=UPI00279028D2|nr:ABC transporter ATP-binding protein [Paenibacillus wynnii]MDQ0194148.1 ABC-2 type transport system ATP-binding protein [Paenibacillus wynnii]
MSVLTVTNLRKSYGTVKAVEDINFTVEAGEVFTIIGPNGAGKTTTLEMIEGLQEPDAGAISINGLTWKKDESEIKTLIGVQPQSGALFELLTAEENLDLFASFYPRSRKTSEVLEMINLTEHRGKRVKSLSGGQRQRLAIGLAMINDPRVIFLDEPTTGLDPQARRNIWDIIMKLKALGTTIILTTHYMEEAEKLSDRVCIVDQGHIISLDTPAALISRLTQEREMRLSFHDGEEAASQTEKAIQSQPDIVRMERDGANLTLWSVKPEQSLYDLLGFTKEQGYRVEHVSIREMSLEDVFIAFTGKEWRD